MNVYLNHIHIKAKSIQGNIQHNLLGQIARAIEKHVSFNGSNLVVAGELGWVHDSSNLIALQGIKDLLPQPVLIQQMVSIFNNGFNAVYTSSAME